MAYIGIIIALIICYLLLCGFRKISNRRWPLTPLFFQFHRIFDMYTESLQRNNGTLVLKGSWFYPFDILFTSDPNNVQHVMRTCFSNYPKGLNSKKIFDVLGETLFNADLDEWRSHRRVVQTFFSDPRFLQANLKINLDVIEKGLLPVFEHVSKNGIVVDLQDLFPRLMYDMASLMTTGYDPATLHVGFPRVDFAKALDDAGYMFLIRHFCPERLWKVQKWLGVGPEKSWSKAKQVVDEIAANIIEKKQEELKKGKDSNHNEEGFDALKYLMTNDVLRSTLPKSALRDAVVGLMFAARDTTSAVLSWFFWLLSKNPLVESKIIEELTAQISIPEAPNAGILLDTEKLKNLVYLHAALCETLRLFPPIPFQRRVSIKPDILPSGHRVNPKTDVILCSYAMGRMESIWGEDCLEFKPERWISEDGKVRVGASSKFLAFSSGPRICPGKELAFTRLKAVLATIIHNYHVQVVEGQVVTPLSSSILYIKNGLKVRITKRWT